MNAFKSNIDLNVNKLLFLVILLISFISAISFRTDHYQELDSRLTYNLFEYDPSRVAKYVSGSFFDIDSNNSLIRLSGIIDTAPNSVLISLKDSLF